jgi:hypothetical protein
VPIRQIRGYPLGKNVDRNQSRSGHRKKVHLPAVESRVLAHEQALPQYAYKSFTMKLSVASMLRDRINSSAPTGNMAN